MRVWIIWWSNDMADHSFSLLFFFFFSLLKEKALYGYMFSIFKLFGITRCHKYIQVQLDQSNENVFTNIINIWSERSKITQECFQLDLTVSMATSKSSILAPVTSFTTLLSFKILNVGTTLIPSSFASACNRQQSERASELRA